MQLGAATGYFVVFAVIGGLELVDRTSFALIAVASREKRSLPTWAGGASAFVVTTTLAVTVGAALVAALGPGRLGLVRVAGGAFLIAYAVFVYLHPEDEEREKAREKLRSAFTAAFLTIFLLELGDTTMVFETIFVTDWGWFVVLVAGAAALVTVAAWDVLLGRTLGARIDPALLRKVVVVVLLIVGAVTIAYGVAPTAFAGLGFAAAP